MKVRIISHENPELIGRVCDIVYYDYDEKDGKVIFKAYDGQVLELQAGTVRVIFEDLLEREEIEKYVFEKAFKKFWG